MTNQHPITPPPELVGQWLCSEDYQWGPLEQASITITTNRLQNVATHAARWGADQELEACCELVPGLTSYLRDARRPKPPSLKAQALKELEQIMDELHEETGSAFTASAIRRALEALDD